MSSISVSMDIAQKELPNLLADILLGNDVVITQGRKRVARIVPIGRTRKNKAVFGSAKGMLELSEDFDAPLEEFAEYMA